ncbi:MAG: tetratricopeptide repeat protein [Terriglobia bacterium]
MAVARLLREDGSLSGHEANRFYLNLGDGTFADASAVVGLDSDRDGRAFATFDWDGDGDLDLIIKNRNSPQLSLHRNQTRTRNHGVAFELTGRASNRDAVGAAITLETSRGTRTSFVRAGSGFLSQSTPRVYFGLGPDTHVGEVIVQWPGGREQRFQDLPADQLILLQEGSSEWTARPFAPSSQVRPGHLQQARQTQTPPSESVIENWLLDPLPVPTLAGQDVEGKPVSLTKWSGQPVFINFWATWCTPCQKELPLWSQAYDQIRAAGAEVVSVSVDDPGNEAQVREFARKHNLPFPVVLPDQASVQAYNILQRSLYTRRHDLEIPTTYLVDAEGNLAKVYRGLTQPAQLLADLKQLPAGADERLARALPYPGRVVRQPFQRDYIALVFDLFEGQADQEAKRHLPRAIAGLEQASQVFPESKGLYLKLSVFYMANGQSEAAVPVLQKVIALDPNYADAYYNLSQAYERTNRLEEALQALRRYVELAPNDAEAFDRLGLLYFNRGDSDEALRSFEHALRLQPDHPDAVRHLGMIYYGKRYYHLAAETLEKAVRLRPDSTQSQMVLALSYFHLGKFEQARSAAEKVLQIAPTEKTAQELLEQIDQVTGRKQP